MGHAKSGVNASRSNAALSRTLFVGVQAALNFQKSFSAPILRGRGSASPMATTPANRAVENGRNEQGRKQRRSEDSRVDSAIVIIGILTIIVGAIGAAITAFMG
jgi:hypothetical protein